MFSRLSSKQQFFLLLAIFFVINLLQGTYTLLFEDEAYYWVWSKHLDWGYFDHPPLVALWIKISSLFFSGELGVRFFASISFSLMLWFIWQTIDHPKKNDYVWLFFLTIIGMVFLNVFGFIVTPDTPLMLFIALFLWAYKRFLSANSFINVLWLAIAMAGLLYSKYHGVLIIGFVVLSNPKLLMNMRFWLSGLIGLLMFLPHLYWQYLNDFPSFRYHLFERSKRPYSLGNTLMHLVNQLVIVGITFPIVYKAFFKTTATNLFTKALKFITYGFFLFFLLSSFSSSTQAQWTAAILIPLSIITFKYLIDNASAKTWFVKLALIQLAILLIARVLLAVPSLSPIKLEPHWSLDWVQPLKDLAKNKPVVFVNSYRNAAVYEFYTGTPTHSYSILKGRKSQYNLEQFEQRIQNQNVIAISKFFENQPLAVNKIDRSLYYKSIPNYQTFEKVQLKHEGETIVLKENEPQQITFTFYNPYNHHLDFKEVNFVGVIQGDKNKILSKVELVLPQTPTVNAGETVTLTAQFIINEPLTPEAKTFRIGLDFYQLQEGYQGDKLKIIP